jgi:hypothetical protein
MGQNSRLSLAVLSARARRLWYVRARQIPPTVKPVGEGKGQGTKATENVGRLVAGSIGKSA